MEVKVFGTNGCPKCKIVVNYMDDIVKEYKGVSLKYYDMETVDGLEEGAFNEVVEIPTIILLDRDGIVGRWSGELPSREDLLKEIKKFLL